MSTKGFDWRAEAKRLGMDTGAAATEILDAQEQNAVAAIMRAAAIQAGPAHWMRPYPGARHQVRACRVSGLTDHMGYADEQGRVWIDATITPLVVALNVIGYPTGFCCSGLPEDHRPASSRCSGYISFDCTIRGDPLFDHLPEGFAVEGSSIIRVQYRLTSARCRAGWKELEARLAG